MWITFFWGAESLYSKRWGRGYLSSAYLCSVFEDTGGREGRREGTREGGREQGT